MAVPFVRLCGQGGTNSNDGIVRIDGKGGSSIPGPVFELGYHQRFGICGTGVTTERMELPDGRTGWRYSEIMNTEQMLWLTIVFDRPEESEETGTYVLMASPELSVWEQIEPEFEGILESVRMENPADG